MFLKKLFYYFIIFEFSKNILLKFGYSRDKIKKHVAASKKYWRKNFLSTLNPPYKVQNGIFSGLIYPTLDSYGSTLIPKLLGVYESELYSILQGSIKKDYKSVFNVGCGEGYYIVGLSILYKNSCHFGIDSELGATLLAEELARKNGKIDSIKFITSSFFNFSGFEKNLEYRNLIICDAEGFEFELFPNLPIRYFINSDLIIELHEFLHENVLKVLINYFQITHYISLIDTINSSEKLKYLSLSQLKSYSSVVKKVLIEEDRPSPMKWLICNSKIMNDS